MNFESLIRAMGKDEMLMSELNYHYVPDEIRYMPMCKNRVIITTDWSTHPTYADVIRKLVSDYE